MFLNVILKPRQFSAFGPTGAVEPQGKKISPFTTVVGRDNDFQIIYPLGIMHNYLYE
jgi:hypothetical protein